jgi:hypothetical protein
MYVLAAVSKGVWFGRQVRGSVVGSRGPIYRRVLSHVHIHHVVQCTYASSTHPLHPFNTPSPPWHKMHCPLIAGFQPWTIIMVIRKSQLAMMMTKFVDIAREEKRRGTEEDNLSSTVY